MRVDDIKNLKIDQQVRVRDSYNTSFAGVIKSINDWTKRVGVIDINDVYKEYPPRLIILN